MYNVLLILNRNYCVIMYLSLISFNDLIEKLLCKIDVWLFQSIIKNGQKYIILNGKYSRYTFTQVLLKFK